MSRRRRKNPLLGRIVLISVVIHVIALPILAHFGAFKQLAKQFGQARVVMITPSKEQDTPESKKKAVKTGDKSKKGRDTGRKSAVKSNTNAPKVVTAPDTGGSDNGSGQAVESGNGAAGVVPTKKSEPVITPQPAPKTEPVATSNPTPKPETPKVESSVKAPPKAPVFAEAQATFQPQPEIPNELRTEEFKKTLVAEVSVGVDGKPGEIKIVQSTGVASLDDSALTTLKQWRFKAATRDGAPVAGKARVTIDFEVKG